MRLAFFDYELPSDLIAQEPAAERDQAGLLLARRNTGSIEHYRFHELPRLLEPGDLLVLNDTRVIPARLTGRRRTGGRWEGLFLGETEDGRWEILSRTGGRRRIGEAVLVDGGLTLVLTEPTSDGTWLARPDPASTRTALSQFGHVPLPPYIRKGRSQPGDAERYQTVYARRDGAVAAPTAGLHFTPELLEQLRNRGISQAWVTLHIGPGTFRPIQAQSIAEHRIHKEWGELPQATVDAILACRVRGGRVVAVGTTSVRVLETVAAAGRLEAWQGMTGLYIYPPYRFQVVDGLITNFHLPRTTLLLLVSAFGGIDLIRQAYMTAVEHRYRFYSYGDAMLVL